MNYNQGPMFPYFPYPGQWMPPQWPQPQPQVIEPEPAEVEVSGFKFKIYDEDQTTHADSYESPAVTHPTKPTPTTELITADDQPKKRKGRPRKDSSSTKSSQQPEVQVLPTIATYDETTAMLNSTLAEIDMTTRNIDMDIEMVRNSKVMKNKYGVLAELNENRAAMIQAKIACIKELNNSITKANDMDYKKEKDRMAAQAGVGDDKHIMDLYTSFIQNPVNNPNNMNVLGPTAIDATLGMGVSRTPINNEYIPNTPDVGYLSYLTNMTPEQKMMSLDSNPNIKQVVVYDASTSNKVFQVMDMSTMQVVPGVQPRDPMFMEGVTIDLKNKIAKSVDLNETYPLIIINDDVTKEY